MASVNINTHGQEGVSGHFRTLKHPCVIDNGFANVYDVRDEETIWIWISDNVYIELSRTEVGEIHELLFTEEGTNDQT